MTKPHVIPDSPDETLSAYRILTRAAYTEGGNLPGYIDYVICSFESTEASFLTAVAVHKHDYLSHIQHFPWYIQPMEWINSGIVMTLTVRNSCLQACLGTMEEVGSNWVWKEQKLLLAVTIQMDCKTLAKVLMGWGKVYRNFDPSIPVTPAPAHLHARLDLNKSEPLVSSRCV
ncbi:hypothetical protein BDP27DRAFT_1414124 [Rhodocollybia butyracea]|uniref:Uncharacterized protein n=1 Tax=Rhodocollybia butyracea TaxID=206335 RepID=A0A9P5Q9X2_9AGAR|nr:hypothetical protein BDP27DRAFT_1414124 [Rhodocollybia butyracea]